MSQIPAELWSWLAIAGLGLFHGVNPAMGWLFAVALGLHRHSQNVVLLSLLPIALGHAAAVAVVLVGVLALGWIVDWVILGRLTGLVLVGWAVWHFLYGHRRRVRVGMQTGMLGLAAWSFFAANVHGAGLMMAPVAVPLCLAGAPGEQAAGVISGPAAVAAVALHTATMLAAIGVISLLVYNWLGVAFLRRQWVNVDLVWSGALGLCGAALVIA